MCRHSFRTQTQGGLIEIYSANRTSFLFFAAVLIFMIINHCIICDCLGDGWCQGRRTTPAFRCWGPVGMVVCFSNLALWWAGDSSKVHQPLVQRHLGEVPDHPSTPQKKTGQRMDGWMLGGTGTVGVPKCGVLLWAACLCVRVCVCMAIRYFCSQVTGCEVKKAEHWFASIAVIFSDQINQSQ